MFISGSVTCVVANLGQNPLQRPIVGRMLPTLLKHSYMWKINKDPNRRSEERSMTAKDCLICKTCHVYQKQQLNF